MSSDIHARLAELKSQIPLDSIWVYFNGGNYRVMYLELNATDYEDTHEDFFKLLSVAKI